MRITGLSEVIGSWKIMPISRPRTDIIASGERPSRSRPFSLMVPPAGRTAPGRSPITAFAHIDLPEPDSPTMHKVSPALMARLRPFTALARSAPSGKAMVRLSMERMVSEGVFCISCARPTGAG